jgi:hypothetical protein
MANLPEVPVAGPEEAELQDHSAHTEVAADHGAPQPELLGLQPYQWVSLSMAALLLIAFAGLKVHRTIAGGLDGKIAEIRRNLDEAKALRAEAEALRAEYAAKIAAAEKDAAAMITNAETARRKGLVASSRSAWSARSAFDPWRALGARCRRHRLQLGVVRIGVEREARVRRGVFVRAVEHGFGRQRLEPRQAGPELRRRCLRTSARSPARTPNRRRRRRPRSGRWIGDMAVGVARRRRSPGLPGAQRHGVAVATVRSIPGTSFDLGGPVMVQPVAALIASLPPA